MQHILKIQHARAPELPSLAEVMSRPAGEKTISARSAYRYLFNIEEFPEMLPLAYQLVARAVETSQQTSSCFPDDFYNGIVDINGLPEYLNRFAETFELDSLISSDPESGSNEAFARIVTPTMAISGCWLHNLSRVGTAHTSVAGILNKQYALQTMAYNKESFTKNQVDGHCFNLFARYHGYRAVNASAITEQTANFAFEFPLLLLSFAQFPREFLPEILGLNLAWFHLGIHGFIEKVTIMSFLGYESSTLLSTSLSQRDTVLCELALKAIETFLNENEANSPHLWKKILCGSAAMAGAWQKHVLAMKGRYSIDESDPVDAMLALIRNKSPYAIGYHKNKRLGPHKIDELLDMGKFDPADVLTHLANSSYVVAGNAAKSRFTTDLVEFGGPMVDIFTQEELVVVRNWINSLGKDYKSPAPANPTATTDRDAGDGANYPLWEKKDYINASRDEYANRACSLRELYYRLVNIEYFPEVLPMVEKFLIDRLHRSRATLPYGERPIPDLHYSDAVLERWVFDKHREQIDAYQPLDGEPHVSRTDFIDATVRLAPLLLIDGGWLQGSAGINTLYNSSVGTKLFRVFFEEIGEGDARKHHSNLYRELLEAMGVMLPDVTELDFAMSDKFPDSAFEVPAIWLSLSCFSRHYMPEILGLNLAVELAGVGAGYLEAHDTLEYFGFPTLFVDIHNAADNASVGHAALAVDAIKIYMNELAEREGLHSIDAYWHRIWTGMRLTLPASSDFYWNLPSASSTRADLPGSPYTPEIFQS